MHLVSTTVGFSPDLNPHSCLLGLTVQENSEITGGTGLFAHASGTFTGTISSQGLLPRNPDGSCAVSQPSLHEVDTVTFSGTLSFRPRCSRGVDFVARLEQLRNFRRSPPQHLARDTTPGRPGLRASHAALVEARRPLQVGGRDVQLTCPSSRPRVTHVETLFLRGARAGFGRLLDLEPLQPLQAQPVAPTIVDEHHEDAFTAPTP
jgi:hypothetical protein